MSEKRPKKRSYDSSRRQEQARYTRLKILEAARALFVKNGYSGATIESIAKEAGVAVDTVYASFGNKREILTRLISHSLVGDDDPTPLLHRQEIVEKMRMKNQHQQIQAFAEDMAKIMTRLAPLFELMRTAAKTETDIADMFQKLLDERVGGMRVFAQALLSNGPLKDGLTIDEAAETIWVISSGEVFTLLVMDRHWPTEKYTQWLSQSLSDLILPQTDGKSG